MTNKKATKSLSKADQKFNSALQETPIAIIGMASVFANAKNLDQYWDNIFEAVDSIIDVPESRWAIDDYYSDDKKAADKTYCKRGGFIPELDFDPMEFGLPPNILELTDIAQLLSLVVARDVLNDAGIGDGSGYDRDKIGITLGVGGGQKQISPLTSRLQGPILEKVLKASGLDAEDTAMIIEKFKKAYIPWEENSFPGMLGNVISGRIANRFDFGGTNCVVDAACAGSLAAIKLAVSDLLEHRSEVMISGGVCCDNSPFMYMSFSKTPAFTTNDDVRPFDEDSKGMMVGEGIGMMAFKRLEDAERDGDRVYAVLKGIGTSSDGRFKSIYAPRPDGQAKALKRAYLDAGFAPETCGLIEAHGTGTLAGDAAEFGGLTKHFSEDNEQLQHIALGSVKSQIGHTKSAAGSAGMIKAVLALHHKVLPPSINIDQPGTGLNIEKSPLYLNSMTRPWMPREDGIPRRAGVSSFGFGGTNYHMVLEEYQPKQSGQYRINNVPQSILVTAPDEKSLVAKLNDWRTKLSAQADDQPYIFNALVTECNLSTPEISLARCGFIAKNADDAIKMIDASLKQFTTHSGQSQWSVPTGIYYRDSGIEQKGKVVALFSGQGSQYVNMGSDLACNFPSIMETTAEMDNEFSEAGLGHLSIITYPIPVFTKEANKAQEEALRLTQHAQPAIGTLSMSLYKAFEEAGFKADFTAGHSFGELTALWAAGVLNDSDYRMLAMSRGQAMKAQDADSSSSKTNAKADPGTMIAVIGDAEKIAREIKEIKDISIANYNSNNQVVVAGVTAKVMEALEQLKANGYKVVQLPVSAAFHTPLVGHAQKPFAKAIDAAKFNAPTIPVFSNATGKVHSSKAADIKKSLKNHILESVYFKDEIDNIYATGGRFFIEFGPKNVLTKLVENILVDKDDVTAIAVNANPKKSADLQMRQAALQMAVLGLNINDIDTHSAIKRPVTAPKASPMVMKLSAASYVSPKTKKIFADALSDGWTVKQTSAVAPEPIIVEKIVERVVEKIVYVTDPAASAQVVNSSSNSMDSIERSVNQFVDHQQQLLNVHQQYMEGPKDYAKTVDSVLQNQAGAAELPQSIERTLGMYHQFQSETLKVHEQYLNNQTDNMSNMLGAVSESAAPAQPRAPAPVIAQVAAPVHSALVTPTAIVAAAPVINKTVTKTEVKPVAQKVEQVQVVAEPAVQTSAIDLAKIQTIMMDVVADKTGYPAEMLELEMDMEADLGIDSIKRVEILGAVQELIPDLPELNPEDLAELRTLGEIVDYMTSKAATVESSTPAAMDTSNTSSANIDLAKIQSIMMEVVADKTGYPAEMLELEMDMEADLGIDSIKRVEILGAVQELIPDLPELNPEDLAELRTLGEIVDYMTSKAASVAPLASAVKAPVLVATSTIDLDKIQSTMMEVVADKTGYPSEMLELEMDMEADLGIDSIKRVEILGAVQELIPDLPELNPEDLAELRTLGEIVDYMKSKAAVIADIPTPELSIVENTATIDLDAIQSIMMEVVADKTGYPAAMLELEMDMEADLGIDSIKRVEILGAVQELIPDLPELNPEDLAELRTLGEIVDYMTSKAASLSTPAPTAVTAPVINAVITTKETTSDAVSPELFTKNLMMVVAEKTGYPAEMLELDMDMEADLGIDSIKRVEILGAVQDSMEGLPEVEPETLAEMRTLGEIVAIFSTKTVSTSAVTSKQASSTSQSTAELVSELTEIKPAPSATVAIKRLSSVNKIEQDVKGSNLLIVDDGTGSTVKIATNLVREGWNVTAIKPTWVKSTSKKAFPKAVKVAELATVEDDAVQSIINEAISNEAGNLSAVIYMQEKNSIKGIEYPENAKQGLMLAFLLAKHCNLNKADVTALRSSFMVVTRQGSLGVDSNEHNTDLVQGGLNGLVKTLSHEWPEVFCRTVDVSSKFGIDKVATIVIDEFLDTDNELVEVAHDKNGRLTLIGEVTDSYNLEAGNSIDSNSVFLVSGGAKGVTAHCVIRIAKQYQSKFILLGRSTYENSEPSWANGITESADLKKAAMQAIIASGDKPTPASITQATRPIVANREITQTLDAIKALGGQVEYVSADVTDSAAVKSATSKVTAKFGEVTGIIHGAGVLADRFIEQKTLEEFNAVYKTKIDGLISLLACAKTENIKHLVLFSSAAGFYGNPGQSDYSIANEILNKTAFRFKALYPSTQVLSFNWGPWDGGMVTAELKRMFNERGVYIIPLDAGADLLLNELAANANRCPQILVGNDLSSDQQINDKKTAEEGSPEKKLQKAV
jgi:polyketide-type polyunsaturated fatty acid synthase PfaA